MRPPITITFGRRLRYHAAGHDRPRRRRANTGGAIPRSGPEHGGCTEENGPQAADQIGTPRGQRKDAAGHVLSSGVSCRQLCPYASLTISPASSRPEKCIAAEIRTLSTMRCRARWPAPPRCQPCRQLTAPRAASRIGLPRRIAPEWHSRRCP
jgi:hypothetical protein